MPELKVGVIISRAHEVLQDTAETIFQGRQMLVCAKCGLRGGVDDLFGEKRCTPTMYRASSGWKNEATPEEQKILDAINH